MLHLSKWIGEKSLAETNLRTALDVELRNMKRALVISCMEQLCRGYANDKDCVHQNPEPDCKCFYVSRNEIQSRASDIQKMASRLFFASSNWSSSGHASWFSSNMRMREVRFYWLASEDPVIVRNAHLLNKKCQNWAEDADNALRKLSNILGMDIVQVPSDNENDENEFEDPDADTTALAADFAGVSANSQPQSQTYNVNESTIESEIKKFLSQHPSHFSKCKFEVPILRFLRTKAQTTVCYVLKLQFNSKNLILIKSARRMESSLQQRRIYRHKRNINRLENLFNCIGQHMGITSRNWPNARNDFSNGRLLPL